MRIYIYTSNFQINVGMTCGVFLIYSKVVHVHFTNMDIQSVPGMKPPAQGVNFLGGLAEPLQKQVEKMGA